MPNYAYDAVNNAGKKTSGTMEAASADEALKKIRAQGLFPSGVKEQKITGNAAATKGKVRDGKKKKKGGFNISFGGVSTKNLTLFTRQLSTLQDAGLPLLRSMQILESQQRPGALKTTLQGVCEEVEAGTSLSDSMAKFPKCFDRLYTKMVAAGEVGGVLDVILQRLAEFMEKGQRLKRRIIGAMIYPTVVIFIAVAIVTGIMYFVIPKFQEIFEDFDVKLPDLTIFMIAASKWVAGTSTKDQVVPGAIWVLCSPVLIFLFFKLVRKTGTGKAWTDIIVLKIPVVGTLIKKTAVARFTRTLGTLISAGVPILEAILITRDTSGNYVFERALGKVHDSIREGETFAGPLRESKVCDAIVVNMIDVGEETGDLDVMLMKIADNYDEEVDVAVASLLSLLEPFMVVILGGIVLVIVLALFLPLVSMIESVSNTSKK
ncbi:MAG: type II secretion system F family protein [Planctomycetota bacterium]|nr:MAG: type II secretion system F family protein [Planctomycetota bacterium]RLS92259.1 MAG: type II secretion system F family protein [Planctomycetota bacterium]